jgi:hypothetical protein
MTEIPSKLQRREFVKGVVATGLTAVISADAEKIDRVVETEERVECRVAIARRTEGRARIKSAVRREETLLRHPVSGDNWHMSWGSDDRQYVSLCDGAGFDDPPRRFYNNRMLSISGGPSDAKFHDVPTYPLLARPQQTSGDARYYGFGTLALDGCLYQYLSTLNRPARVDEIDKPTPLDPLKFNGVKLIYSPNGGRTWHNQSGSVPVSWEPWDRRSRETMVFFEEDQGAFSLLTVLQMGKNYEYNRDGYIYVYAPNGDVDGRMNELVMFRVPRSKLRHRDSYEFFAGHGRIGAKWSREIEDRRVVHAFPRGWVNRLAHPYAWHPSVVYNAPLRLYMMANWGMGTGADGVWFNKPSYLGLWVAQTPWGPWTQIFEETEWLPGADPNARAYQPQISPRWIAADGRAFWLVWTDFQVIDTEAQKRAVEAARRTADGEKEQEEDVIRSVLAMREFMPYYTFNLQRIDLNLA